MGLKKTILVIVACIGVAIGGYLIYDKTIVNAVPAQDSKVTLENLGQFMGGNKDLVLNLNNKAGKIAAQVNGEAITETELKFLGGMWQAGGRTDGINIAFNKLVEERLLMHEARLRGLLPTKAEISAAVKKDRDMSQDAQAKEVLDPIIMNSGLTEDEFWNVVQRYYTTRVLATQKLYEDVIKNAVGSGKLIPPDPTYGISPEEWEKRNTFFTEYGKALKKTAQIVIVEPNNLGLRLERDIWHS